MIYMSMSNPLIAYANVLLNQAIVVNNKLITHIAKCARDEFSLHPLVEPEPEAGGTLLPSSSDLIIWLARCSRSGLDAERGTQCSPTSCCQSSRSLKEEHHCWIESRSLEWTKNSRVDALPKNLIARLPMQVHKRMELRSPARPSSLLLIFLSVTVKIRVWIISLAIAPEMFNGIY
jgi:hypothetical protein